MKFIKYQKHWLATVKLLTNSGPKETSNEVISAPLHSQNTLLGVCIYVRLIYTLGPIIYFIEGRSPSRYKLRFYI